MHLTNLRGKINLCWDPPGEALATVGDLDGHVRTAVARLGKAMGPLRDLSVDVQHLSLGGTRAGEWR